MNENGWGLKEMFVLITIIAVGLFISAYLIQFHFLPLLSGNNASMVYTNSTNQTKRPQTKQQLYQTLESQMTEATSHYVSKFYPNVSEDTKYIVPLSNLIQEKLLYQLYDPLDKKIPCNGYVVFQKREQKMYFTPYLSCDQYQTKGYSRRFIDTE